MLPPTTGPAMPMANAAKIPLAAADLMPAMQSPAMSAPPAQAAGLMTAPGGAPLGGFPPPDAPADPPYDVVKQADGSAVWMSRTNPPFAIGVVPPPKLPPALQPPK